MNAIGATTRSGIFLPWLRATHAWTASWPSAYGYWVMVPYRVPALDGLQRAWMPSTEMTLILPALPAFLIACAAPRPIVSFAAKMPVMSGCAFSSASVTCSALSCS